MPLCTLHLVSLSPSSDPLSFLRSLPLPPSSILLCGLPRRWIILPSLPPASHDVLAPRWDVVLLLKGDGGLPTSPAAKESVALVWSMSVGIPSALVDSLGSRNASLLSSPVPELTGSLERPRLADSNQGLEADEGLIGWARGYDQRAEKGKGRRAVTMLNLLAFKDGMKDEYLKYGKAFAESIGSKRGGVAKIVGSTIKQSSSASRSAASWDEIAFAQYPTAVHFVDMAASEDYQNVNHAHRLPALKDTCILCVAEVDVQEVLGGEGGGGRGEEGEGAKRIGVEAGRSWETGKGKSKL